VESRECGNHGGLLVASHEADAAEAWAQFLEVRVKVKVGPLVFMPSGVETQASHAIWPLPSVPQRLLAPVSREKSAGGAHVRKSESIASASIRHLADAGKRGSAGRNSPLQLKQIFRGRLYPHADIDQEHADKEDDDAEGEKDPRSRVEIRHFKVENGTRDD
jgi:hypothetical protein